jgi:non-heme chloroperoxidase
VLQHGGGQTRHAWKGAGQILAAAGYYAVALDARGHGDSDWSSEGRYDQDAMVEDLQCVVGGCGYQRAALVGASMGGGTSLVAVGEDRVDATALVLVDIAPRIETEGVDHIRAFMNANPDGFASLEAVAASIAAYQPQRKRPRTLVGLAKNVRVGADGRYRWHWDPQIRRFTDLDLEVREHRLRACARRVKVPTLLVRGGMSDVLSDAGVQDFMMLCPHAQYVDIPNAAHMVAGDRNDIFSGAVVDFLSRVVPPENAMQLSTRELHPHREGPPGPVRDLP